MRNVIFHPNSGLGDFIFFTSLFLAFAAIMSLDEASGSGLPLDNPLPSLPIDLKALIKESLVEVLRNNLFLLSTTPASSGELLVRLVRSLSYLLPDGKHQ